jgi:hypothetical protein
MEGFLSLLAFGTLWYFLLTGGWIIAIFWCVETESGWGSGIWTILYLCFLQFIAKVNFLYEIIHHPIVSLIWVLSYFMAGFLWSWVKWWLFVHKKAEEYREKRYSFLKSKQDERPRIANTSAVPEKYLRVDKYGENVISMGDITLDTPVPEFLKKDWEFNLRCTDAFPTVRKNKKKISMWITYWPVSMVWSLVNDFVKKFIRTLVMKCRVLYDGITKSAFKGLDIPVEKD